MWGFSLAHWCNSFQTQNTSLSAKISKESFLLLLLFLLPRFCICLFPFFSRHWKEFPSDFFVLLVRCKVRLAAFHVELKVSGWQHLHLLLPSPHMELQAHLEPSPSTTTSRKPSTKNSRSTKISTRKAFR